MSDAVLTPPGMAGQLAAMFGRLPDDLLVGVWSTDKMTRWAPASDLERLARLGLEVDRAGLDAFLLVNPRTSPMPAFRRGGNDDVAAVVGLWADVDHDLPGHAPAASGLPHPTKAEADEVLGTCAPPPTLRWSTGGGEHLEWLFGDPILILNDEHRANLQQLSNDWHSHLAESFRRAGLHFDQTGDLARHLRLVGTHRRKGGTEHRVTLCPHLEYPTGGVFKPDGSIDRTWRPENIYGAAELEGSARLRLAPSPGPPPPPPRRRRYTSKIDGSAADTVDEQYTWGDILRPEGWHCVSDADPELWHRGDGASSEYSLKAWEHACVVWSSAADLPHGKGQRLSKFRLLAHMRFGGNESACGRAVRRWMNEGGARP